MQPDLLTLSQQCETAGPEETRGLHSLLADALASELVGAYDCIRVWEAWSVGTMGQDDFSPVQDRIDEITEAVLAAILPELREIIAAEVTVGERYSTADRIISAILRAEAAKQEKV